MAFTSETARLAGQKSRRGPAKKLEPNIKEKMELLYDNSFDYKLVIFHVKKTKTPVNTGV